MEGIKIPTVKFYQSRVVASMTECDTLFPKRTEGGDIVELGTGGSGRSPRIVGEPAFRTGLGGHFWSRAWCGRGPALYVPNSEHGTNFGCASLGKDRNADLA